MERDKQSHESEQLLSKRGRKRGRRQCCPNGLIDAAWRLFHCDDVAFGADSRGPRGVERTASRSIRVNRSADPTHRGQTSKADPENRLVYFFFCFLRVRLGSIFSFT